MKGKEMEIKHKKMGRPRKPIVLSNAERQQRWRDRVKRDAHKLLLTIKESNENEQRNN
jgi:hypothetical protein